MNQLTVIFLLLLLFLIKFVNGELKFSTKKLSKDHEFEQIDPGKLQYILKPGDFLGLSKLSKNENDELQKICGKTDFEIRNFKVSKGNRALPGQFPWAVALGEGYAYCSGTIISSRHILTAAHCVSKYHDSSVPCHFTGLSLDLSKLKISYGGVCLLQDKNVCPDGKDMKSAKVRKFLLPQHFNEYSCENGADIAIMELEEDLVFNEKTKPICVGYFISKSKGLFYDLGFGRDENGQQVPNLRYIQTHSYEKSRKPGNIVSSPKYLSLKGLKQPGICHGDSGGPFQINIGYPIVSYIHGVHSFGSGCSGNRAVRYRYFKNRYRYSDTDTLKDFNRYRYPIPILFLKKRYRYSDTDTLKNSTDTDISIPIPDTETDT